MARPELYREYPEPNEAELVSRLIGVLEGLIKKPYLTGTTYRDTHAKGLAAVRAVFEVDHDLPAELRVGLFATPRRFDAWVRFSNLSPTPQKDIKKDIRAMAIKLLGVPGERLWRADKEDDNLDLIMMGSQTFLAPDLPTFLAMEEALLAGGLKQLVFFLTHPRIVMTIVKGQSKVASVLEIPYWSQTAYAFGEKAVQYHMRPVAPPDSTLPREPSNNYLRDRLVDRLGKTDVVFEFMVQLQTDPVRMPIENPMVAWDPELSPYRRVATLRFPKQSGILEPERCQLAEDLAFNPWRTLPEHRPLGGINRARLEVYPAIARFRHRRNDVDYREPKARELDQP